MQNVFAPTYSASFRIQTSHLACVTQNIQPSVVPGWRRPRAIAGIVLERSVPGLYPELSSSVHIVGCNDFLTTSLFDCVSSIVCDGNRGVSNSHRFLPN